MITLLPPNSTKLERALVEATDYTVDSRVIKGVKFDPPDSLLPWLIWEYGLEPLLPWLPDPRVAIKEGILWQRLRGTPASLKLAYSWAGLDNVILEEEPEGAHYAEFQVGLADIPKGADSKALIELAKLSAPVRSRLTRIYNERYDVRRFVLDQSDWGDLLSDYSGNSMDDTVLSFGRMQHSDEVISHTVVTATHDRYSYGAVSALHDYRLDYLLLSESDILLSPHASYRRKHDTLCVSVIGSDYVELGSYVNISKAQLTLSDSKLGDVNSCFPAYYKQESGQTIALSADGLSETLWSLSATPITERFNRHHSVVAVSEYEDQQVAIDNIRSSHIVTIANLDSIGSVTYHAIHHTESNYTGVVSWHGFVHPDQPWNAIEPLTELTHVSE